MFKDSFWAIVPAIIAIVIALVSKEVYVSLFVGIFIGAFLIVDFNILQGFAKIFELFCEGLGFEVADMANSSYYNLSILIFLVLLGILVVLVNKSGGAKAYGEWSSRTIKGRKGVLGATIGLGAIISVDDYFNNLTVGSIMVPVIDKHNISHAKLSYIIDSIAAPVCILCPLSSWAVAVSGVCTSTGLQGFESFIRTIPSNFYALLTIAMLITLTVTGFDYGKMLYFEKKASEGNDESVAKDASGDVLSQLQISEKGKVYDLFIPILVLIFGSIFMMLYTGGLFSGEHTFIEAFGNCDSGISLCCGAFFAIVACLLLYIPRRVLTYKQFTESLTEGFKSMVPALLILVLAWTLNRVCQQLEINSFVNRVITGVGLNLGFVPALFFILALGLAFATGTSWGTFTILIPIGVTIVSGDETLIYITIAAILSGAVCGDHVSPISDTTILASTGSKCNHIIHVQTQMPYALLVALVSFIGFILNGFIKKSFIVLIICMILLVGLLLGLHLLSKNKEKKRMNLENENKVE